MAFLDPIGLLVFFGAIALAYAVGRLVRNARARRRARAPDASGAALSRAERRRRERGRR